MEPRLVAQITTDDDGSLKIKILDFYQVVVVVRSSIVLRIPDDIVEGYYCSQRSKGGGVATERTTGRIFWGKEKIRQARYPQGPKYVVREST